MTSLIHPLQTVSAGSYSRFVQDEALLPHDFMKTQAARVDRAYQAGEPIWMIVSELRMIYETRPMHVPMKTPRAMAQRVEIVR